MENDETAQYNKNSSKITELSQIPAEQLAKQMANPALSQAAPNLTPLIHTTSLNRLQFLNSKIPKPAAEFIGDDPYEPSNSAKEKFNDYHKIVHDPVSILDHVKEGTLTQNHMEALQNVYPNMLQDMQKEVMGQINPKNIKDLPYHTKASLSKFVGQPIESSLLPQVAMKNQATYASMPGQVAPQPQGKPKRASKGSASKLGLAQRSSTQIGRDDSEDD